MTLPIAGWYPDPDNAERSRWWNGMSWTDSYADNAAAMPAAPTGEPTDPASVTPIAQSVAAPVPYGYQTETLTAPADTKWSTPWIWLIVLLPFLVSLSFLFIDFEKFFVVVLRFADADPSEIMAHSDELFSSLFSPALLLFALASWAVIVLNIVFAYVDWRELKRRGVPQPFHWAWAFLQYGVYQIGRSVVVNRRVGKGLSPIWVTIILWILSSIVISVYFFSVFAGLYQEMPNLFQ